MYINIIKQTGYLPSQLFTVFSSSCEPTHDAHESIVLIKRPTFILRHSAVNVEIDGVRSTKHLLEKKKIGRIFHDTYLPN